MGRHSAPDDHDDSDGSAAVLSVLPSPSTRPLPGRHSGDDQPDPGTGPEGLDVIETVMAGDDDDEPAPDGPATNEPAADEHTAQIQPIVDPVLDEPLPNAVTTLIAPVVDGRTPPPRPAPTLSPDPSRDPGANASPDPTSFAEPSDVAAPAPQAEPGSDKAAKAEAKAEAKALKAEAKAAQAEAKASAKAAKPGKSAKPGKPAKSASPHPDRVSDLTLLRTDSAARARVIAAIVVPFVLYVGVLLVLDTFDLRTALIWIWVPLISAGVVAGLLLDLAHRAAAARAIAAVEHAREPASPS